MANKRTRYNKQRENGEIHPEFSSWITSVPSEPSSARCKLCKGNPIDLCNMGAQSLKSHIKSKKHQNLVKTIVRLDQFRSQMMKFHLVVLLRITHKQRSLISH